MSTPENRVQEKDGGAADDLAAAMHAEARADLVSLQAHVNVFQAALEAIAALSPAESSRAPMR